MKKKIILSICITYYFERDYIYELMDHIKKIKKKNNFEVLIRNDNPKQKLSLKDFKIKNLNIKIFNSENKSKGEVSSLLDLKKKSRGDFICFVADDDLISPEFFNFFLKEKIKKSNYLCHATPYKKYWGKKNKYKFINQKNLLKDFFSRKIYLSACVGMIIKKSQINEKHIRVLKDYNLDLYLLSLISDYNLRFINYNYGYNNVKASMISSKSIDPKMYYNGIKFLKTFFDKSLYFLLYNFFMDNFYSNIFRENSKKFENIICATKIYLLFKDDNLNKFNKIKYLILFYLKIAIKVFINFLLKLIISVKR